MNLYALGVNMLPQASGPLWAYELPSHGVSNPDSLGLVSIFYWIQIVRVQRPRARKFCQRPRRIICSDSGGRPSDMRMDMMHARMPQMFVCICVWCVCCRRSLPSSGSLSVVCPPLKCMFMWLTRARPRRRTRRRRRKLNKAAFHSFAETEMDWVRVSVADSTDNISLFLSGMASPASGSTAPFKSQLVT